MKWQDFILIVLILGLLIRDLYKLVNLIRIASFIS